MSASPGGREVAPGVRLTAPGALLVVLVPALLGGLLDGLFGVGYGVLTGLGFAAGCIVAALKVRSRDLLLLATTPPLLFAVAVTIAETLRSWGSGSWLRNEIVALTVALAGDAFWIVTGTTAVLVIAAGRGLIGTRPRPSSRDRVSPTRPPPRTGAAKSRSTR